MKKTIFSKEPQFPMFASVRVATGPLAGMEFSVVDHTPVKNGKVRVKYASPDYGPRIVVTHHQVRNEFSEHSKAEDVRIAFSKLLPADVCWDSDRGYSERKRGTPLTWDTQLARFVYKPKEKISAPVQPSK